MLPNRLYYFVLSPFLGSSLSLRLSLFCLRNAQVPQRSLCSRTQGEASTSPLCNGNFQLGLATQLIVMFPNLFSEMDEDDAADNELTYG
ncbi:hypothetical protein Syun_027862 [Stephania yunnanensis]|uniref:Uncharacterized protein n=1 Tax=Stephania yunnanensis TaxID=152371 RepID=A0AAP0EGD0_9MAGN